MEITEPRRLYQLAAELKSASSKVSTLWVINCPPSALSPMKKVSRTVVREAIIMLEVEGYVEVRKGSGIHVISNHPRHTRCPDESWNSPTMVPLSCCRRVS
jgi:GntR family hexuronate regulon transcriptional repressor